VFIINIGHIFFIWKAIFMKIIIRVSSEIIIKSKPVRKRTIRLLTRNIKVFLSDYEEEVKINDSWDRIDILIDDNIWEIKKKEIIEILSFIPWIYNFYEIEEKDFTDLDKLFFEIKNDFFKKISSKTFVVRVHRVWTHSFGSVEAERYLGGLFLENAINAKVKLKDPDVTINIDIKDDKYYTILNKYDWIWGYPVGFQWKVLSLISWWFDSGVSTYLSMKRWCSVDFLFFNLGGSAHELGVKQVANYLSNKFSKNYKARFVTINFEEIVRELTTKVNHKYRWIILKRLMLRCACQIWQKIYFALVKWDSLGQVSSQTLSNMSVIDKASSMLVLRPLITFDKQEIIDISQKIGTYNFACNMPEYCWVISDRPATQSEEEVIVKEEKNIEEEVITRAIYGRKIEKIQDLLNEDLGELEKWLEVSYLPSSEEIIIDIRDNEKIEKDPLKIKWSTVLNIPFYDINHKFENLDQTKTYLFYCEKGVLSKLHALYLKEKWFDNIKIFRFENNQIKCAK